MPYQGRAAAVGMPAEQQALSVSAAMNLAKGALESVTVRIIGEVSEVSNKPGYKAVYFTVKDKSASLPCMMWNNRYQASGVQLRVGALVEMAGRFTLYAAKGRMNFDVFSVSLAGEGNLRMQVANLARKLQAEGLMTPERKRALPALPQTIGLVTSPRGAAVHDVLRTLRRRYPLARVLVAGVPVEGAGAPAAIIEGMRCVVAGGAEVVLVVRGGGSFEDLMPFNDEALARAIASLDVPVVTGIGHEPDTSIADMVADLRASTPTAAAEAVAPAVESVSERLGALSRAMASAQKTRISRLRMSVDRMALMPLFKEPSRLFEGEAYRIDELSARLGEALPRALEADRRRLDSLRASLAFSLPRVTQRDEQRCQAYRERLRYLGESSLERFVSQMSVQAARLHDLSPLTVIARGYSITRNASGDVVKSIDTVNAGDRMEVTVSDGIICCNVDHVQHVESSLESWEETYE